MHRLIVVLMVVIIPVLAYADTIYLKSGRQIKTDETWEENGQIKCYRFGSIVGYPLEQVERIEKSHVADREEIKSELLLNYKMACSALKSLKESIDSSTPLKPGQTKALTQKWIDCATAFNKYFSDGNLSVSDSAKVKQLERQSEADIRMGKAIVRTSPDEGTLYMMKGMYSAGKIMKITWDYNTPGKTWH